MKDTQPTVEERLTTLEVENSVLRSRVYELESRVSDLIASVSVLDRLTGNHEFEIEEVKGEITSVFNLAEDLQQKLSTIENDVSDVLLLKS